MTRPIVHDLLPDNLDVDGRYWLKSRKTGAETVARWISEHRKWRVPGFRNQISPGAASRGFVFASRHPLPSSAVLNRLHDLPRSMTATRDCAALLERVLNGAEDQPPNTADR